MRVLKWPVPVDDQDHPVGGGRVVHVGAQGGDWAVAYVWTEERAGSKEPARRARVYGTGQEVTDGDLHLGSAVVDPYVWHVYANRA